MKILSLDLGKNKTVGCDYERESGQHRFKTAFSTRNGLAQLVKEVKPDRVDRGLQHRWMGLRYVAGDGNRGSSSEYQR
jgi:hypothetical protein